MKNIISGKCWVGGHGISVYDIIPEARWTMEKLDSCAMGNWIFESYEDGLINKSGGFKQMGYNIIVAGKDFGCGSKSVEHPMAALKGGGIMAVIAESYSRYSYRNAINLGLPVITCPDVTKRIGRGDDITINMDAGIIENRTTGDKFPAAAFSGFAMDILSSGGILNYLARKGDNNGSDK